MSDTKVIISIAIIAAVTALLRFLPFAVFSGRPTPKWVSYLGRVLPFAIMGMLVVFCLKDTSFSSLAGWVPYAVASVLTAVLRVFSKNTLVSIVGGTACYMILVQFVFI